MHELRRHRRMKIPLQVEIRHPTIGTLQVEAHDISDGGVFLLMDECFQIELGESVTVRALGLGADENEAGPTLTMQVVRLNNQGMGLAFEKNNDSLKAKSVTSEAMKIDAVNDQSIMQCLFIMNNDLQILFTLRGDHWALPTRKLEIGESWQDGITQSINQLKTDVALGQSIEIKPLTHCFPSSDQTSTRIDMLIPCRLANCNGAIELPDPDNYRWVDATEIANLNCALDPNIVDNIMRQV